MYCSSCGVAVTQGLTYCKNCGARIVRSDKRASTEPSPDGLITMMVATFVMGLFAISGLMAVMKAVLHFEYGPLIGVTTLSFLIMVAIEIVFITLLFRRRNNTDKMTFPESRSAKELEAPSPYPLDQAPSVTEHTTRAFDPIHNG